MAELLGCCFPDKELDCELTNTAKHALTVITLLFAKNVLVLEHTRDVLLKNNVYVNPAIFLPGKRIKLQ